MIGKILGKRYEILEKVGVGGMAVVYRAKDQLLNRFVAVKILRNEYINDQEFLDKFRMEAQSAASLSHQNIVNIYDVGVEEEMPYIVMEFVPGATLKEYIEKNEGFLTNSQIADFSRQIALALEHAHSNQIIHRDIKPHNILVAKDGTLKVADFGIASAITEATTSYTGEAIGSVRYSSPEQARGRNVDIRTDLYSLGVLMYEMATRQVPFEGDTAVEIALKHMKDDIKPPSEINSLFHKGLESVVMRSLLKNINERYQTARELVDDLNKIINNPNENVAFYDFESESPTQKIPSLEAYDIKEGEKRTMKKKKQSNFKLPNKQVLSAIGVVLLAFLTVLIIFVVNNMEPESKEPVFLYLTDVVGMPYEEAKTTLVNEGYVVEEGTPEKNNEVEEGYVSSMSLPAGSKLKPGFRVSLNISTGASKARIPNLVFETIDDAEVILSGTKFTLGDITYVNEDLDKGYILSQDPAADTEAKDDAKINLTVSLGPEYTLVIVPRLTDSTLEEAQEKLATIGLTIDQISYEEHPTIEKDQIISQSVPEGTEVEMTRMIDLVISTGNEEEEEENPDGDLIGKRRYLIPLSDYVGQEVTIEVWYEKAGVIKTVFLETLTVTAEESSKQVEVEGSGQGILSFFINGNLLKASEVDFSN